MKKLSRLPPVLAFVTFLFGTIAAWAAPHGHGVPHGGGHPMHARAPMGRGLHEHAIAAHDWRHHHWHGDHVVYDNQYVTYAPPVVVDSPPAYESEPGINLVFPLNIH